MRFYSTNLFSLPLPRSKCLGLDSIFKILIQFNSALSKSNEVWQRKEKSRRRQTAAAASNNASKLSEPKTDAPRRDGSQAQQDEDGERQQVTFETPKRKGFGGISQDDRREGAEAFFGNEAPPKTPNNTGVNGMNFNQSLLKSALAQRRKSIKGTPDEDRKGSFGLDDDDKDGDDDDDDEEEWNDAK